MIDLCTPREAARSLATSPEHLLALVNEGRLAAYNIGGAIRFRQCDVGQLRARLALRG